jgi:uncharacterized protein (TIGR00255 family)
VLLSMTGFGDARRQCERFTVAIEARAVNNRYLKIVTKCPDAYAPLEGEIEKTVRAAIARGTVTVQVRIDRLGQDSPYLIDRRVLESYSRQLNDLLPMLRAQPGFAGSTLDVSRLLELPGVVNERESAANSWETDWPIIRETLEESLKKLHEFRATEGRSMEADLRINARIIVEQLEQIATLAPQVVHEFRDKILERVRELLHDATTVGASDLIREVSIFSERCDINEEITRLRSHLEQFDAFLAQKESAGRKLEFLSQEMFREVNTIGSKANNVPIAHCVVEMKAAVEKIREVLQNVE